MLKRSSQRWDAPIAFVLIIALLFTLFPTWTMAQSDNEVQSSLTAEEPSVDDRSSLPQEMTVVLATGVPVLGPLPTYTNQPQVHVTGSSEPEAAVSIYLIDTKNIKTLAGQVTADEQGAFAIDAQLAVDGVYKFTAIAEKDGQMSPESVPVQVTLDRVSPAAPYKAAWLSAAYDEITLQWQSAEPFGSLKFHIYREGVKIGTTDEMEFRDTGLLEQSLVTYKLVSEDLAGNLSEGASTVEAGTLPDRLTLLGTSETGVLGNGHFAAPSVSGDGNTAAFFSDSTNLIQGTGQKGTFLLYIRDLAQNKLESVMAEGMQEGFATYDGTALSHDGRFVAFSVKTGVFFDIYLKDRGAGGSLTRISAGNGDSYSPSISADGKLITFASRATNLTDGDTSGLADVFVYNRETGQMTRIAPSNEFFTIDQTNVSANGRFITWTQRWDQDAGVSEVVLHDILTGESTTLHEGAGSASISGDGRFVAYSTDLAVYVYDRNTGVSKLVKDGIAGAVPQISIDGNWIAFGNFPQLLWENVVTGESKAVGNPAANSFSPQISGNGSKLVYNGDYTSVRTAEGHFPNMIYAVCPASCSAGTPTDQPIESVVWTASAKIKDQAKLGGELTIATAGAAGGTSRATVSYRFDPPYGGESEMRELVVTLTESTVKPGTYSGILPLEEGMAEIVTITGEITDSQGKATSRAAERLPLKVTGAVQAEVELSPSDADTGVLDGARLIAWSAGKKTGAQSSYDGTGSIILPLADAPDYKLSLIGADGTILAEMPSVLVRNGQYTREKLTVRIPAHIRLNVSIQGNGSGLEGVTVSVRESEGGLIGSGVTNGSGSVAIDAGFTGETVTLSYDRPSPYAAFSDETITLETLTVIGKEATINYGTVAGTVLDADGKAISDGTVTVTRPNSVVTVKVNDDGSFRLSAPEGESMISVVSGELMQYQMKQPEPVVVKAGEETAVELTVLTARKQLNVELSTQFIGEESQQLTINANTGSVYDLEIREEGGPSIYRSSLNFPTAWFESYNGAKLSVCVIDRHERFATVCEPITVDGSLTKVTFHLAERAAVTASLPQGLKDANISLYELTDEGKRRINGIFRKEGPFRISLPHNSTYVLDIWAIESATGTTVGVTRQFTAADGQVLDLGTLQLLEKGIFQNKPGNMLDVLGAETTEGGVIRLRGTYRYDSSVTPLSEAALLLSIPAGTTLIEQSVMLNGQPAQQVDSAGAPLAEVKLPAPLAKGAFGTIYYELRTGDGTGEYVQPELGIRFKQEGSQDVKEETIGSITVSMIVVSLIAPLLITKRTLNVSGLAPAGSTVIIEDGQQAIGQAEATPGGTWSQVITLAESAQGGVHSLAIRAVRGDDSWHSEPSYLTYDPNYPNPTELSLLQPGLRAYKADVSNGVSRFPYSLDPNKSLVFGLKFSHPERIERAILLVAGEEIPLTLNPLTNQFEALKTTHQQKLGGISVTYDVTPLPYDPGSPTEEDIKQLLPPELRNANVRVTQVEQSAVNASAAADSRVNVATVEISSQQDADDKITAQYYYEPMPDYIPGPLPAGAPQVYDLTYDYDHSTMTGYFSAIVPVQEAAAAFKRMGIVTTLEAEVVAVVRIGATMNFDIKTPGAGTALGLAGAIYNGYDFQQKMNELDGMLDRVMDSNCLPSYSSQYYSNVLNQMAERLFKNLLVKYTMQIGAMALAASGIGLIAGAAVLATTVAIGIKMTYDWENDLNELKAEFAADNAECEEQEGPDAPDSPNDDSDDRKGPNGSSGSNLAEPDWVYDPSGYAYEAVESNRLEGVTATLLQQSADGTSWSVWNAGRYLQQNPLFTDGEGRYAWDVPEGNWQVRYDKAGYDTAKSEVLTVLPPHFDVNVGLVSREAPQVTGVLQTSGKDALFVKFSKYMLPDTLSADLVKVYLVSGEEEMEVPVTIEAVHAEQDPDGRTLATTYKFIPQLPFVVGSTYQVTIDSMVQSYAGVPMLKPFEQHVTIVETLPPVQEAVRDVTIIPGYGSLGIRWEETDNAESDHLLLKWKAHGSDAEEQWTVGKGESIAALTDLSAGSYDIRLVTVSLDGRESTGVTVQGQPLVKVTPPVETTPPAEVLQASVEAAGTNTLTVKWTDPNDLDLYYVSVRLKKPGNTEFEAPVRVAKGKGTHSFSGLTEPGPYEIKLTAVDIRGNESAGVVVQETILETEPEPEPDPDAANIEITLSQKSYDVFDGALNLQIPKKDSLPVGTKIGVQRSATAPETPPDFLKLRSPVYMLESGERPGKGVELSLKYDMSGLKGSEHLKLGIYRYDPNDPNKWIYVGGIINPAKGQIRADITEWGTYAVFFNDH